MTNNRIGGLKTRDKNLARDPDFYRKIGARGGKACVSKGFGADPVRAREAGRLGGKHRWINARQKGEQDED